MEQRRTAIRLLLAALVTSIIACAVLYRAGEAFFEHRKLRAEVAQLEHEYETQLEELGQVLSEEDRLRNDTEAQEQILIDRFGYARPDETPIIIVDQDN
jgi:hypothetical protein